MKYSKIAQKKYCCVGACLEMVLNRHGITKFDQEEIAYELGLIVPPHLVNNYRRARTGAKPASGYGTQIQNRQYSINRFFTKNEINLQESYHYITDLGMAENFLANCKDQDILIVFHCGTLYNKPEADWGHMVLFDHLSDKCIVIQENSAARNIEKIELPKLIQAIKTHGTKNGAGFYLIKKR